MPRAIQCPACQAAELTPIEAGGQHCAGCGATFQRRLHWGYYVGAVVVYGVALGAGTALVFEHMAVRQAVLWTLFGAGLWVIRSHATTLRRV